MSENETDSSVSDRFPRVILHGVDTLVLNVRYVDEMGKPTRALLDEQFIPVLNDWQGQAKQEEKPVPVPLAFKEQPFQMHPHGAGKGQWRWLLTSPLLNLSIGLGKLNGVIAQVRLSSEYLWQCQNFACAVVEVVDFLCTLFGDRVQFQPSEVHLCADVMHWDLPSLNWQRTVLSRGRYRREYAESEPEATMLEAAQVSMYYGRALSTLQFGSHGAALSAVIYDKTREITQQSRKTWFWDFWKSATCDASWDGQSTVWRIEFRFKRDALNEFTDGESFHGINDVFDLVERLPSLWAYAVGHVGETDAWLRYVTPNSDTNMARWPLHPTWMVVQQAFADDLPTLTDDDGNLQLDSDGVVQTVPPVTVVRKRKVQVNVERAVKAIFGYAASLAAFLGGYQSDQTDKETNPWMDIPMVLT